MSSRLKRWIFYLVIFALAFVAGYALSSEPGVVEQVPGPLATCQDLCEAEEGCTYGYIAEEAPGRRLIVMARAGANGMQADIKVPEFGAATRCEFPPGFLFQIYAPGWLLGDKGPCTTSVRLSGAVWAIGELEVTTDGERVYLPLGSQQ